MKMFLTRIGFGAKVVVTGDLTQIDLPRGNRSGLEEARALLGQVRGLVFTEFGKEDVVRHPLVARIVEAYDKKRKAPKGAAHEDEDNGEGNGHDEADK
jgi:phosphate starvation-inducible PhoH-like protein